MIFLRAEHESRSGEKDSYLTLREKNSVRKIKKNLWDPAGYLLKYSESNIELGKPVVVHPPSNKMKYIFLLNTDGKRTPEDEVNYKTRLKSPNCSFPAMFWG